MRSAMPAPRRQQGMTLVIGLIMLIMISLAAVASYQMTRTSTEVVGNMQFQAEAVNAADAAIQEAVSTVRMFQNPNTVFLNPCGNVSNTRCFDFNGDGQNDMTVTLAPPTCTRVRPKPNAELNLSTVVTGETLPRDTACVSGVAQQFGVKGAATGNSQCAESTWELIARARDTTAGTTGTDVTVTQGVEVRVSTEDAGSFCP